MNLNSKLQQQALLNKKLQRLLASSLQQLSDVKSSTDSATKAANDALQAADASVKPTALTSGLAGKANLVHTHSVADIIGLTTGGSYTELKGWFFL
jgi:3-deoxy-D-arabino-heptulosonate 7-phosphate (DAHP) synthase